MIEWPQDPAPIRNHVHTGPTARIRALHWTVPLTVLLWAFGDVGGVRGQDQVSCAFRSSWCELSEEQAAFLRQARHATETYRSVTNAVADGFRPVGADAPAMGRHWVNLARLFDGEIDAARPEILMYAVVDGRETLVGIGFGYVVASGNGKAPPPNPFEGDAWHVHSGRLDMESHRTDHEDPGLHDARSTVHGRQEAGISVLHAWVPAENPAGVIEPNNWALPYLRLGLPRPDGATPEVDRAISLASLGGEFFMERAKLFADQGSGPAAGWTAALRRAETEVMEWWHARSTGPLTPDEIEWLDDLWRRFGLMGL